MQSLNYLKILVIFIVTFSLPTFANQKLHVEKHGDSLWYPRTAFTHMITLNGEEAYQSKKGDWYFVLEAGLAKYTKNNKLKMYSLPNKAEVSGMAVVKNRLWIASRRHGVYAFNPETDKFLAKPILFKKDGLLNLRIHKDSNTGNIIISSFKELYFYTLKENKLVNVTDEFKRLKTTTDSRGFIETADALFLSSLSNNESLGGLVKYDKKTQRWTLKRKELFGSNSEPERADIEAMYANDQFLWVFTYQLNAYNFYVSVLDFKKNKWSSYHREKALPELEKLIDLFPRLNWKGNEGLSRLLKYLIDPPKIQDHPYGFDKKEIKRVSSFARKGMEQLNQSSFVGKREPIRFKYGFRENYIVENKGIKGQEKKVQKVKFNKVHFKRYIGSIDDDNLLVHTDNGLQLLNLKTHHLHSFSKNPAGDHISILGMSKERILHLRTIVYGGDDDTEKDWFLSLDKLKLIDTSIEKLQIDKNAKLPRLHNVEIKDNGPWVSLIE